MVSEKLSLLLFPKKSIEQGQQPTQLTPQDFVMVWKMHMKRTIWTYYNLVSNSKVSSKLSNIMRSITPCIAEKKGNKICSLDPL